jgi:integral membrane protein
VSGALQRYRVLANVVGVVLVVFLLIAVPLRYLGGEPRLSETISPVHGFLYVVYLGVTVDLARRAGWSVVRTLLVGLAGTVPFLSFVVERRMTRDVEARLQRA